jgi:glutaredoxin
MRQDFCVFILTHGRPDKVKTLNTLKSSGYAGKTYLVCDDEDKKLNSYIKKYGKDMVLIFNKNEIAKDFDEADNFNHKTAIVYARNACWKLAKQVGVKYYIQFDDDYTWFGYRTIDKSKKMSDINKVFDFLINFLQNTPILSVAFSQGGDHIGGYDDNKKIKRKAMNSFVCSVDKPFTFIGKINEDVNTYVNLGNRGGIFFTIMNIQLTQVATQQSEGGMTAAYLNSGTYIKSFYTILFNPSCVTIKIMGTTNKRLHHSIDWDTAVPCIIQEKYKKS